MKFGVTQPNQGAAARPVRSAGDTANPDELKMTWKNINNPKSWQSDSWWRNGAIFGATA
jgi:hypothetical protein